MKVLTVKDLEAWYGSTQVLNQISFEIHSGQVLSVFGHNGVGKTTLLRTILGLTKSRRGIIQVDGVNILKFPTHEIVRLGISYAPQESAVFAEETVRSNLELSSRFMDFDCFDEMMEIFPRIHERLDQKVGTLSGGEQKMLLAVRTLGTAKKLAVLDEIVEGVQPSYLSLFQRSIKAATRRGVCVLMVEQHINFALPISDDFMVLQRGRVIANGLVGDMTSTILEKHLTI